MELEVPGTTKAAVKVLPVLAVISEDTEVRRIAVCRTFFSPVVTQQRGRKGWMTLLVGISPDSFNDALHKAVLERIHENRLSGSTSKRLEVMERTVIY